MLPLHLKPTRSTALFVTGFLLGVLLLLQTRSFRDVTAIHTRDASSNVFRELQVLYETNHNLADEVASQEDLLAQAQDRSSTIQAFEQEVKKFEMLTGAIAIHGPGVRVSVPAGSDVAALVDLVNELLNAGAETISINGIRLTGNRIGFDAIPNAKILLNSAILEPPYIIDAIGESVTIENALRQPGGIIQRFERTHPGRTLTVSRMMRIDASPIK